VAPSVPHKHLVALFAMIFHMTHQMASAGLSGGNEINSDSLTVFVIVPAQGWPKRWTG